ncbi:hypothetical protein JTE90_011504 [Oedothorax gibbosus]|uniref:Chordin n=1 Tax=Oedothorax gibbosus TaxID=931172 RepID=A0AAV6VBI8_9ARAC|nr:hypothetical protein JTE90_011504 [Oedothorax gibbosus]
MISDERRQLQFRQFVAASFDPLSGETRDTASFAPRVTLRSGLCNPRWVPYRTPMRNSGASPMGLTWVLTSLFLLQCTDRENCLPVQRKKRISSRVKCKDIKNDCPKPTCDDPVLLPERCCKSCPGEDYADLEEDIATRKLESEDEDKILKEFTILLTGKMIVPPVPVSGAARGNLVFTKRDLHYTIHYQGIPRPTSIRFTSEEGNILEEHIIPPTSHHTQNSKVCGVWRKVPKVYRRLLQKDKLLFVLVTPAYPDGMLAGRVLKHNAINTEAYGSLLLPDMSSPGDVLGSGGMAHIFPVADNAIHVSLGFNGIFTSKDARDSPLVVSLLSEELDGRMEPITEVSITLPKAHPDYNHATVKLDLAPGVQDRLASGRLELRITSKDGQRRHKGRIVPKVTCNVFQAVVTTPEWTDYTKDPVIGFMILDIGQDGFINYKLHLSDGNLDSVTVKLETEVETPGGIQKNVLQQVVQNLTDSWGNGTFRHRANQAVEMLLSDDLVVSVYADAPNVIRVPEDGATERSRIDRIELRGQIRQRLYTDALLNDTPVLLSGINSTAGGIAWLSVDRECVLHYQVSVSGLESGEKHLLEMLQVRPGKHNQPMQRVLKRFEGEQVDDVVDDLDGRGLSMLQAGYTFLVVTSKMPGKTKMVHLRAQIQELSTPGECLPRYDVSSMQRGGGAIHGVGGGAYMDGYNDVYGTDSPNNCLYEDALYDDGAQWKAEHQECSMCSCQRGRVVCERSVCPEPVCDNPMTIPGECCPFCPGNSTSESALRGQRLCFFDQGDKKYHVAGSRWHPYVPPFGFSMCSLCTCEPKTLTVKCDRIQCPPLTCADKDAYRENSNACCKKCPNAVSVKSHVIVPPSAGHLGDQGGEKMLAREILSLGGCKFNGQVYPNGDEWHPTIEPYGEEKCIKCHCKDGKAKCRRKRCPKETCPVKVPGEDGCCDKCLDTVGDSTSRSSESSGKGKKRRKERERRHRKIRQPKERQP